MLPSWVTGGLRCPPPLAGSPGIFPGSLSGPRSSPPALSGTHTVHSAAPETRPQSAYAPRPLVKNPQVSALGPQDPQLPAPPESLGVRPLPRPSLARTGGRRAVRTQERPSRDGRQVRRVRGRAGSSSHGRGHWRRRGRPRGPARMPNKPGHSGGRYLVGRHRAEALEDGQDVLLAGVSHCDQITEGAAGPVNREGPTRNGCRLPELEYGPGGGAARDGQAPPRPRPQTERTRRSLRPRLSAPLAPPTQAPHPALHARAQEASASFPGLRLPFAQGGGWPSWLWVGLTLMRSAFVTRTLWAA